MSLCMYVYLYLMYSSEASKLVTSECWLQEKKNKNQKNCIALHTYHQP